jgi:cobyric acid synthase CobQ
MMNGISGLKTYPASANFLLAMITRSDLTAGKVADRMLKEHGIAVRVCTNIFGLDNRFLRFAVRTEAENIKMVEALEKVFEYRSGRHRSKPKPAIMFQGTSSNAGKSVLTAAMGRILLQDGYRVAPFKSQNMSLNSFVTRQGGEMGRAQVVQAQACKLDPDVRMNPILLKPNTDTGSQVIVNGKPVGNMDVKEYVHYKPEAFEAAKRAYDSLAGENDVMVIEGAGSPAEINLKHHDIVNMQMARYAQAPVLLVGDIDRGGVYASFVGTMELLTEWERAITAGFIVNRFRGDSDLLKSAHDYVLGHTGRPVLGVVPYFHDLGLPEEDSVSFKNGLWDEVLSDKDTVRIAVIDLPHISNFTDFDALRIEPDVQLQIIRSAMDFNAPDAVIIPGSKNTIGDLEFLKRNGLADKLRELNNKVPIIGICGGFQMLGSGIADPYALETSGKTVPGLGLLEIVTLLEKEKTLTRIEAKHIKSGRPVFGYEIHHGISDGTNFEPAVISDEGKSDGAVSPSGMVWGTYIHGIFDSDDFRRWFINELRVRKNLAPLPKSATYDLESALDRLAESVRNSIRLKDIYKLMGL